MKKTIFSILCVCMFGVLFGQEVVRTGAECMEWYLPMLQGQRVAVCGNQTSMVGDTHLVDTLMSQGVQVVKIFCPEHGFRGKAEAGAHIASSTDPKTGLPIISLYGKNRKPQPEQMQDLDVVVFDLQDVGCRFYTYISTLHYVMEAAAEQDVKVVVLDRPNPNGYFVDGPVLDTNYRSFVGMHPVPVVYGMTIGEYAQMINGEGWLAGGNRCQLTVIRLENYTHATRYDLPVSPSPNLPNAEAVYLYPSLCFFEGTNVSVGRGTSLPFQIFGAPDMKSGDYTFTPVPIAGVSENPPCKNLKCRGYNLHQRAQDSLNGQNCLNLEFLIVAYNDSPDKSKFFAHAAFFDKLAGTDQLRKLILADRSPEEIRLTWTDGITAFMSVRNNYLLYEDF